MTNVVEETRSSSQTQELHFVYWFTAINGAVLGAKKVSSGLNYSFNKQNCIIYILHEKVQRDKMYDTTAMDALRDTSIRRLDRLLD
jgi:hypothetical protein